MAAAIATAIGVFACKEPEPVVLDKPIFVVNGVNMKCAFIGLFNGTARLVIIIQVCTTFNACIISFSTIRTFQINHIKGEKIETDTLYWNRAEKQIYTDCYVRLTSDSGMMQGYGMTSDERARNSVILRPFDSYAVERDSTYYFIDTLNQMGPFRK